jgi:predicted CopG family antitoxin
MAQIELSEISVHKATYDRIKRFGKDQDSYSEIIDKMCDVIEGKRKRSSIIITDTALLTSRSE